MGFKISIVGNPVFRKSFFSKDRVPETEEREKPFDFSRRVELRTFMEPRIASAKAQGSAWDTGRGWKLTPRVPISQDRRVKGRRGGVEQRSAFASQPTTDARTFRPGRLRRDTGLMGASAAAALSEPSMTGETKSMRFFSDGQERRA